jgi:hypothetical protein
LLALIQNLLNNSGTAASGSSTATPASSVAAQDVEQLQQQGNDATANAESSSGALDAAQTNDAAAPADPTQDYHAGSDGHAVDYRLSCAYAAGGSVANCRSATGAAQ